VSSELENEVEDVDSMKSNEFLERIEQSVDKLQSGQAEIRESLQDVQSLQNESAQEVNQHYGSLLIKLNEIEKHVNSKSVSFLKSSFQVLL